MVYYGNPCIRVSEKENLVLFLGFLRQFLQTEFQPRVDLKMYLNRWTTQTCYFNYSDSGRNLLKATEQNTECIHEVHAQASIFLGQLTCFEYFMCAKILFSSRSRIYNNIYSYM